MSQRIRLLATTAVVAAAASVLPLAGTAVAGGGGYGGGGGHSYGNRFHSKGYGYGFERSWYSCRDDAIFSSIFGGGCGGYGRGGLGRGGLGFGRGLGLFGLGGI